MSNPEGFCTMCGVHVETFDGLTHCPNCGSTGNPCSMKDQVTISINWHEMRILGCWAEFYGLANNKGSGLIKSITMRIQAQHPSRVPLTLSGELQDLKDNPPSGLGRIETDFPGVE